MQRNVIELLPQIILVFENSINHFENVHFEFWIIMNVNIKMILLSVIHLDSIYCQSDKQLVDPLEVLVVNNGFQTHDHRLVIVNFLFLNNVDLDV